ncbi:MAG: (Fe-S)-binding protein [Campylobacterales bacterium]|nr:(Fe-S)-binding protein [Campylobacterales bacterium]
MSNLIDLIKTGDDCVKCGKCIPVCTIHAISPDETTSPRGFLDLLAAHKRGDLPLDKDVKRIFESCFLCTNCVDVCPSRLPTDTAIEEIRAEIAEEFGITWYKKAFFILLKYRWLMDILAKLGYVFKSCAFADKKEKNSMLPRFYLPVVKTGRLLPSVSKTSFLNSHEEHIEAPSADKKAAVFIGCMANYSYTNIGDSLVNVLQKLGIDILIPKKQLCCGAPAYFTGDLDTVRWLVKKNIEYFETFIDNVDAIVVPEATCSSMMVHDWEVVLKNEPEWVQRSKKITSKVHLATKWLAQNTKLQELLAAEGRQMNYSVTYHDPCHARKTQGVWKEPRALLSKNYPLIEMENPNRCCGFGGVTIQTERFELAQKAGAPKAQMIKETGADIVSAECSACRMQLTNAMYQNGVETVFKNPIELIDEALKSAEK